MDAHGRQSYVGAIEHLDKGKVAAIEILTVDGCMTGVIKHFCSKHELAIEKRDELLETLPKFPGLAERRRLEVKS